ncbi:ATP-binding cassette domain-containing protein [Microbulbifer rhizosphaerae]|uniref:Atypical dual specificity phosphatase n=1 Tax=Microbulbifer rhizosphaerae TaxID=1562603 RepID=A0A7W4ZA15_9GAMM|nr:atypical dual specificity phosphatase [Microbulbifer rhizosphaerae]
MADDAAILSLCGFGVAFGKKTVLASIDLRIPDRGITVLLGPGGSGKSTLLRTLAGFNDSNPRLRSWGDAVYLGRRLGKTGRPALTIQNARLMMASIQENIVSELPERQVLSPIQQRDLVARLLKSCGLEELVENIDQPVVHLTLAQQRHLAIMRLAATSPRLLLLDEPTNGLDDKESDRLLDYISTEGRRRSILIALHNQLHAKRLGGDSMLLAGGTIVEAAATDQLLSRPQTDAGKCFVRTGSCSLPSPDSDPGTLEPGAPAPVTSPGPGKDYVSDSFGPRGFLWLKKGELAGTPRPGIVLDIDYDLKALRRVGVTTLITLTKSTPDTEAMSRHDMTNIWSPIGDMEAPSFTQAFSLCRQIRVICRDGGCVAVHCRAGLGRTGTILAAYLIYEGKEALEALETVRRVEPRWVQSKMQVEFLEKFSKILDKGRQKQAMLTA